MRFEILDTDGVARIGRFSVGGKEMTTPNLFPVVSPFSNLVAPSELISTFGAECCFTNAYILYNSEENRERALEKGIHKYLGFDKIIATDSGAFQHYMYESDLEISPAEIESFQEKLGSDCPVILDIPVQFTDTFEIAESKVRTTIQRAKENIRRRQTSEVAWFGPIHGSIYPDLLKQSCEEMSALDFGIHAIGGVVKPMNDYRFNALVNIMLQTKQWITPGRPLHLFGLGLPSFFSLAVACGADTFDSAAYILFANKGRYFTLEGTKHLEDIQEFPCCCPMCQKYTPKEVKSLPKKKQTEILARHNLYLSYAELRTIRQAIKEQTLWELVEQRAMAHPSLLQALSELPKYLPFLEKMEPYWKSKGVKYLTEYSVNRPTLYRHRKYLSKDYFARDVTHFVFLPQFDEPSYTDSNIQDILTQMAKCDQELQRNPLAAVQVFIVSNIMGLIPLDLADRYPYSQHEGSPQIYPGSPLVRENMRAMEGFLERHKTFIDSLSVFVPKEYTNQFGEITEFKRENHIISYLISDYLLHYLPQTQVFTELDSFLSSYKELTHA